MQLLALQQPARAQRQVQTHLGEAELIAFVEAYQTGASLRRLADRYKVHHRTVAAILERRGVDRQFRALSAEDATTSIELYRSGQSLATIGRRFNVQPHTIRRALLAAGVTMRDTHGRER